MGDPNPSQSISDRTYGNVGAGKNFGSGLTFSGNSSDLPEGWFTKGAPGFVQSGAPGQVGGGGPGDQQPFASWFYGPSDRNDPGAASLNTGNLAEAWRLSGQTPPGGGGIPAFDQTRAAGGLPGQAADPDVLRFTDPNGQLTDMSRATYQTLLGRQGLPQWQSTWQTPPPGPIGDGGGIGTTGGGRGGDEGGDPTKTPWVPPPGFIPPDAYPTPIRNTFFPKPDVTPGDRTGIPALAAALGGANDPGAPPPQWGRSAPPAGFPGGGTDKWAPPPQWGQPTGPLFSSPIMGNTRTGMGGSLESSGSTPGNIVSPGTALSADLPSVGTSLSRPPTNYPTVSPPSGPRSFSLGRAPI